MKNLLKFIGILVISNIKIILIVGGILMISSLSYYGAVDENGERVITFEENATQSASAFQTENTEEKQEEIKQEKQQEIITQKIEQSTPKKDTKTASVVAKETTKDDKEDVEVKKLSNTSQEKKVQEKKEVVAEQKTDTQQEKTKKQEIVEEKKQETKVEICTTENNHKMGVGNSNKWFESQQEAYAEYKAELERWSQKAKSGEIDYDELYAKCPYGYETWSCSNCGKYTLNYYYH